MKIKKINVGGFRCLQNLSISFEADITIIVGENDSGKSSLIDCLKVITQNKAVEADDFNYNTDTIELSVEIEDFIFEKTYKKEGENITQLPMVAKPSTDFLSNSKVQLEAADFDVQTPANIEIIKTKAKIFGIRVRADSNIGNLKRSVLEKIDAHLVDPSLKIENAQFPNFNNIQLDGRHFENVSSFFKEVFLKEKQGDIWREKIDKETTIEDFIKSKIDSYSEEISEKMSAKGIKDKIRMFLKNLTDIRVEPIYQARDLNIDAKVIFLENGREINLQKKGDGTKRRITMALLEFKKDEDLLDDDDTTIYLLDEPDTHLHVRAQIELLETLQGFAFNENQVIVTTHSPFIINAVKANQIRLLLTGDQNSTIVKHIHEQPDIPAKVMQALGVENLFLFFSRTLILVEGKTEEEFISRYFLKKTNKTISSNLIKIINVEGIQNIYGFAKGILEIHSAENLFVVHDNELSDEMSELINELSIDKNHRYVVGTREFEDAFSDEVLFGCWKQYHEIHERDCPENWTTENIKHVREECVTDIQLKFSQKLGHLGAGGKRMTKPIFGSALAEFVDDENTPRKLNELFEHLIE